MVNIIYEKALDILIEKYWRSICLNYKLSYICLKTTPKKRCSKTPCRNMIKKYLLTKAVDTLLDENDN